MQQNPRKYISRGDKVRRKYKYVDRSFIGVFEATEEGGLLTFDAPAGKVIITPVK